MYIVKETFTAKPGQASKLAKLFKKVFGSNENVTVMTDMVSNYNTVIMEMQFNTLAEFEKMMDDYKQGKPAPNITPEIMEEMKKYTDMYLSGKREIFQIVE